MHARTILLIGAVTLLGTAPVCADTTTAYTYDALGRLWKVCYAGGKQIVYTYDPAGNRTQVVTQGSCS